MQTFSIHYQKHLFLKNNFNVNKKITYHFFLVPTKYCSKDKSQMRESALKNTPILSFKIHPGIKVLLTSMKISLADCIYFKLF